MTRTRGLVQWTDWCSTCRRHVTFYSYRCHYWHSSTRSCRRCGYDAYVCVCEPRPWRPRRARRQRPGWFYTQVET